MIHNACVGKHISRTDTYTVAMCVEDMIPMIAKHIHLYHCTCDTGQLNVS